MDAEVGRTTLTADEFDTLYEGIWKRLQGDRIAGLLAGEADLQAVSYCELRRWLEPQGYKVHSEWRLEEQGHPHYEVDLGVADPQGRLWIAMEFKGIWTGRYGQAREDLDKLRDYAARHRRGECGLERGYFCYTSNVQEPRRLRNAVYPRPSAKWTHGYLRIAEGFDEAKVPWQVVRF